MRFPWPSSLRGKKFLSLPATWQGFLTLEDRGFRIGNSPLYGHMVDLSDCVIALHALEGGTIELSLNKRAGLSEPLVIGAPDGRKWQFWYEDGAWWHD